LCRPNKKVLAFGTFLVAQPVASGITEKRYGCAFTARAAVSAVDVAF
jgi:hypothetical protein